MSCLRCCSRICGDLSVSAVNRFIRLSLSLYSVKYVLQCLAFLSTPFRSQVRVRYVCTWNHCRAVLRHIARWYNSQSPIDYLIVSQFSIYHSVYISHSTSSTVRIWVTCASYYPKYVMELLLDIWPAHVYVTPLRAMNYPVSRRIFRNRYSQELLLVDFN